MATPEGSGIAELVSALADPAASARRRAVEALAGAPGPDVAEWLVRALYDDDRGVRRAAVRGLSRRRDRRAARAALELVAGGVAAGVFELLEPADETAVSVLVSALSDGDAALADLALQSLAWFDREAVARALAASLAAGAPAPEGGVRMARVLSMLGAGHVIGPLLDSLGAGAPRAGAVWALTRLQDPRVVAPLIEALADRDERVRWSAACRLGQLGDRRAAAPLAGVLTRDKAGHVREEAARALAALGDASGVEPLLIALARDREDTVRAQAALALAELGDGRAIVPLQEALRDRRAVIRRAAAEALARMGPEGRRRLAAVAQSRRGRGRTEAAWALGRSDLAEGGEGPG